MQYITNSMPAPVLLALRGLQARFASHNVLRDTWTCVKFDREVQVIWSGDVGVVARPLSSMGISVNVAGGLPGDKLKSGDSIILIDPTTGDTYEWYTY